MARSIAEIPLGQSFYVLFSNLFNRFMHIPKRMTIESTDDVPELIMDGSEFSNDSASKTKDTGKAIPL